MRSHAACLLLAVAATVGAHSARALVRPSAFLGLRAPTARAAVPSVRRAAVACADSTEECLAEAENEGEINACLEEADFETQVLSNARVVDSFSGEGAWVLVTRELDDEDDDEDEPSEASAAALDDEEEDEGEEGVILVQDPKDDSFLLTLFLTEEDATRYLYMLLDEDIDSESTYAAAWYSGEEVVELLAEDIKLALVGEA